jgi:hypothetical protein
MAKGDPLVAGGSLGGRGPKSSLDYLDYLLFIFIFIFIPRYSINLSRSKSWKAGWTQFPFWDVHVRL